MKKAIFVLIPFVIMSCASMISNTVGFSQEDPAYEIVNSNTLENRALAKFSSAEYLRSAENERAKTELREPKYEGFPELGFIYLYLQGWSGIDSANPKNFTYIVIDGSGREIYRGKGQDKVPDYNVGQYGTVWYAIDGIWLDDPSIVFPLFLRVVNPLGEPIDITIKKK